MKPPIALWLLISTLASNKASPLGASLYNTYKNNNITNGRGWARARGFSVVSGVIYGGP